MYYEKKVKEFIVKQGFERCFTDDKAHAIANAQQQSETVNHTVYVDDVDGRCIARCYRGFVELTAK